MGRFIESVTTRRQGFDFQPIPGVPNRIEVRFGPGWFAEVEKDGDTEILHWNSRINLFTHDAAFSQVAGIVVGRPDILLDPKGLKVWESMYREDDQLENQLVYSEYVSTTMNVDDHGFARADCMYGPEGKSVQFTHTVSDTHNVIFSFKTNARPPSDVSRVSLKIDNKYQEKWADVFDWIAKNHVNREKFGL